MTQVRVLSAGFALVLPAVLAAAFELDVAVPDEDWARANIGADTRIAAAIPKALEEMPTRFLIGTPPRRLAKL
jgi:hypothetical protein